MVHLAATLFVVFVIGAISVIALEAVSSWSIERQRLRLKRRNAGTADR